MDSLQYYDFIKILPGTAYLARQGLSGGDTMTMRLEQLKLNVACEFVRRISLVCPFFAGCSCNSRSLLYIST